MISRRNTGVTFFLSWIILLWVIATFGLFIFVGSQIIGSITIYQTNYSVYFLGIILSGLVRMGEPSDDLTFRAPSSRWMLAITKANKDTIVLLTVLFAIVFVTKDKGMSRAFLTTYFVFLWPSLVLMRRYAPVVVTGFLFGKTQRFNTLLVGNQERIKSLDTFVNELPKSGLEVAGVLTLDDNPSEANTDFPKLGRIEDLETVITQHAIDQVIVLGGEKSREWYRRVFGICDRFGCHVMIYNFWQDYFDQPVHFTRNGAHTFFTLHDEPLQNPVNRLVKRLIDVAISLPVVLFVLPVLCLWVKLMQSKQAPGPLFFRQYRGGFQKERFKIFKFRSMYWGDGPTNEAKQATEGDSRIYPFGAFIRRRSIDEFPQFINILKGDMSLVGPRPHLLDHDELFSEVVASYRVRHFTKPGLTGLAQVNGYRGEVVDEASINDRIRMDIMYIHSWSVGLEIEIIFKTISELLNPSDRAY
jgi:exopolysaccharide biosynthesis polyprenyl glycosylphosphotransferase